jgi:hypothetical protein
MHLPTRKYPDCPIKTNEQVIPNDRLKVLNQITHQDAIFGNKVQYIGATVSRTWY